VAAYFFSYLLGLAAHMFYPVHVFVFLGRIELDPKTLISFCA